MYIIDRDKNRCKKIDEKTFSELGFRERDNLQEWFAKDPNMFGEELLIIQKEFDGFSDTKERLDLLALDRAGDLVIIENKLDDSGKDVTWQALKYASYCSSLSKEDIKSIYQSYLTKLGANEKAEDNLCDFFSLDYEDILLNQGINQRIILVAANFRKEVTSTVIWLMNFNLRIKCLKVTPYQLEEELFLDVEQIIPVRDTEEYTIKIAEKSIAEKNEKAKVQNRHQLRFDFWTYLLNYMSSKTELFSTISPKNDNWIALGGGISGVSYDFVITKQGARVELYIGTSSKSKNEEIFDFMESKKHNMENDIKRNIQWARLEDKGSCKIFINVEGDYFDKESWDQLADKLSQIMIEFYDSTQSYLIDYKTSKSNK